MGVVPGPAMHRSRAPQDRGIEERREDEQGWRIPHRRAVERVREGEGE